MKAEPKAEPQTFKAKRDSQNDIRSKSPLMGGEKPYSDNNLKERLKQIQTKHKARITDDLIITGAQEKE